MGRRKFLDATLSEMRKLQASLADPFLKTTRAQKHLEDLRTELTAFYESEPKPYTFLGQDDLEHQRYRIRIEFRDAPDNVWLIAGDLFYCLRSSLDQLVWSLASLSLAYPEGTQFPILDVDNTENRKRFVKQTTGVPADAVSIIDELQPYHGRDAGAIRSNPLWRLNLMCNIDKHRRIPIHGNMVDFKIPKSLFEFVTFDGDGIMSVPLSMKNKMRLDPNLLCKVVFGDFNAGVDFDLEGIERIYTFVTNAVIPRFSRFF